MTIPAMSQMRRLVSIGCFVGAVLFGLAGTSAGQTRATITGTVKDASGAPQTGVTVVLTTPAGIDRRQTSGVDGTYTFGGLAPGDYRLRVDDPTNQYAPWSQDKVTVAAGDRATVDIALQPRIAPGQRRGAISGTVIGPLGQPLAGVTVALSGSGGDKSATSATSGAYAFPDLAAGNYQVKVAAQKDALAFQSDSFALAAGERRSVDVHLQPLPPPPPPSPAPTANANPAAAALPAPVGMEAQPDRWNFQYPAYTRYVGQKSVFATGGPFDPYNQNTLKGDRPIFGDHVFGNLNLQFNSTINPGTNAFFGEATPAHELVYNQNMVAGAELFGGDTVFEPRRWALRATTVFNYNLVAQNSLSFGSLAKNAKETVANFGAEELFAEYRLAVISPNFDFVSVRGGMQNFDSDFRGYVFDDNQLGVRLFGNAQNNRDQYNVAFFSMRARDPVSQLHDVTTSVGQNVFIANYFIQDFVAQGYTFMVNFHLNQDQRPTQAGDLTAYYLGFHGDGHWGGLSIDHAFYQVFGHDDDNTLAAALKRPSHLTINARMAAIELSHDSDAIRLRGSFFYASGDSGTNPGKATGFDSIMDNPELAGGQFSFWTQQQMQIPGPTILGKAPLFLTGRFSLLPDLRNKFAQRSNFLNPGLVLVNGGVDFRLMPQLKLITNASYLRFANDSILQALTSPTTFPNATIGLDLNTGLKWRPFLNENLFVLAGLGVLLPEGGMATALGSSGALFSFFSTFQIAF